MLTESGSPTYIGFFLKLIVLYREYNVFLLLKSKYFFIKINNFKLSVYLLSLCFRSKIEVYVHFIIKTIVCFFLFCISPVLFADFQMQQTILFAVGPLNQIGQIIGPSPCFYLKGGTSDCHSIINTYSIATNETNKKISAFLDSDMPKGTCLMLNMSPPSGARSLGTQELSATPVDLVIELSKVAESELPLTYSFETTPEAGVVSSSTRIVFFTLTDG